MQSQPRSKSEPNLRVVGMSWSSTPSTHRGLALARIGMVSVSIITFYDVFMFNTFDIISENNGRRYRISECSVLEMWVKHRLPQFKLHGGR
jgi:hypothetical protein